MVTGLRNSVQRLSQRLGGSSATDGELLSRFLTDREESAFAQLVQRHGSMVLGTCRRVLANTTDAEDAFQAVFVVLLRKARSFTNRVCIGNVLYGIAYYTALKARAMANKRKAKEAKAPAREPAADSAELATRLDAELARLPEKYREPVVLCELGGLSRKEAATKLGIPEGTISSRLATAHRMLAKRLGIASITALLASPVLAVPTELSAAAVQAVLSTAPASVATIAYEVTKMMFLSKLKLGAAVVTGVMMLLATGVMFAPLTNAADEKPVVKAPAPKKKEPTEAEKKLYGKWVSVEWTEGGKKIKNDTVVWTWTFSEKGVHTAGTVLKGSDGTDTETHAGMNTFEVNDSTKPKELTIASKNGDLRLECIYELDGDTLKVCMYKIAEKARPSAFTAKDDTPKDAGPLSIVEFKRVKSDLDLMQGHWRCDGPTRLGTAIPTICWANIKIEKDTVTFPGDPFKRGFSFTLNDTAKPKEMIITGAKHIGQREKTYAIYEFDGDTLRISVNEGDKKLFPTDFDTKATNANFVYEFKRVPPEKVDKIVEPKEQNKGKSWAELLTGSRTTEPAWKTEFRKAYGLIETQMVRRISPPYPDCRAEYFRDMIREVYKRSKLEPNDEAVNRDYTNHFTKFGWKDSWMQDALTVQRVPVKAEDGTSLDFVIDAVLGIPHTRIIGFEELKEYKVTGDFVVREGADPEKLVAPLEKILREECKLPIKFSFKEVEVEVMVLDGNYKANPLDEAKPNRIEVFANFRGLPNVGGGGTGSLKELADALERYVSKPVLLGKIAGAPKAIEWHYQHREKGSTEQEYNEDHDAGMILKNISTQTGLSVTTERKKLRMLVIEKAPLGK